VGVIRIGYNIKGTALTVSMKLKEKYKMQKNPVKTELNVIDNVSNHLLCRRSLEKLVGQKVRFSLRNNHYDRMIFFEADCLGISSDKRQVKVGEAHAAEPFLSIENNKGIEINLPLCKLIRIDQPNSTNPNLYYLIFPLHFWTIEILSQ
jgi:hypothetical protein